MIIVPFLFFICLTLYFWRKHGIGDPVVYMSSLHALVSLFAIVVVMFGLQGEGGILGGKHFSDFGFIPTILYCTMIGLSLMPFSMLYGRDLKRITCNSPMVIDVVAMMLIAVSLLNLYLVADSTLDILQGDLGAVRNEHYAGVDSPAEIKSQSMPFVLRAFYYLNPSTILALPLFFYNICFRHKAWWFNGLLLFASLSCPIVGIQVADRTEIVYYGLMMLFCLFFFWRFLTRRLKRILLLLCSPIVVAAVAYVVAVSQSRFDDHSKASSTDRAIQYAGQGYINFCYFYENANFSYIATEREFPMYNHFVRRVDSTAERRSERMGQQGFFISVFASFIGDIMLDLGPVGMCIWVMTYFMLGMLVIRRSHRSEMDISEVLAIYFLAVVPIFGIFYYRFFAFTNTFSIMLIVAVWLMSRYKLVYK